MTHSVCLGRRGRPISARLMSRRRFSVPLVAGVLWAALGCGPLAEAVWAAERVTLNFNPDWRFVKDDPAGAQAPSFDDRAWTAVSTPHTYNDVDTFDNWSTPGHRGEQIQWAGRTWYRKTFTAPSAWRGKKVFVEFEAARQVAEVYLNGALLGVSKTGFTPFGFDLTPHLKIGATNVLAVMVDNRFMKDPLDPATAEMARRSGAETPVPRSAQNPNLAQLHAEINKTIPDAMEELQADQIPWNNPHWHPAHGGLYRNVRLHVTDPLHVSLPLFSFLATTGPYVYATGVGDASAKVGVEVPVQNERKAAADVELRAEVIAADGKVALALVGSQRIAAGASAEFRLSGALAKPRLWEPDAPHLYRVAFTLRVGREVVDTTEVPLGVRSVRWDARSGFFINGRHLKLHGWGQKPTDEWPGLGAGLPDWLHFYTLSLMRQAGGNFVRWGHAAAGPAQIRSGDRLGLVTLQPGVDGESDTVKAAWQLRAMAFRDVLVYFRNNPSILIWEGGNQKVTREHARELRGLVDRYDPHGGRAYAHRRADTITAEFMDVGVGTEGGREIATLPVVEGEYDREESPRRVWDELSPPRFGYPEAKGMTYQLTSEQYAVDQVGQYVKKLGPEWHSGGANWIFSDTTSGGRVPAEVARAGGEVDGVRLPKEAYFACRAMFRDDPQVHVIGHWTYPAGTHKNVYVVSNAQAVELFVNGRSLGQGRVSDEHLFTFDDVAWEPGTLEAVASTGGLVVARQKKHTAGPPVALQMTPLVNEGGLRADGSDVALIDVEAVDAEGERCPTVQQRVDFETEGPAVWRGGYDSGKVDSINKAYLDLEAGVNRVAIRSTRNAGTVTVRAKSEGLRPGGVTIRSLAFPAESGMTRTQPAVPEVKLAATEAPSAGVAAKTASPPAGTPRPPGGGAAAPVAGRFVRSVNYTGPHAATVRVATHAQNGGKAYADRDHAFAELPESLAGGDWIQVADADADYSAADLIELAVSGGTVVTIAHDERLVRPDWLTRQFRSTSRTITIGGTPMQLFERRVGQGESLTLGSNTDDARPPAARMYVVFVNGAAAGR